VTLGIFGEVFVRGRVIVPGDAAAFLAELGLSLWLIVKGSTSRSGKKEHRSEGPRSPT